MGLLIGLIIWALFVGAGYYIGQQKGRVGRRRHPSAGRGTARRDHHRVPARR
jgi:hypothetical protein